MTAVVSGKTAVGQLISIPAAARGNKDVVRLISAERLKVNESGGGLLSWTAIHDAGAAGPYMNRWGNENRLRSAAFVPRIDVQVPRAGTIRNLFVNAEVAPGAGETFTFTLEVNAGATLLVAVITGAGTFGSNIVNQITVAAGNRLRMAFTFSGGAQFAGGITADMEFV